MKKWNKDKNKGYKSCKCNKSNKGNKGGMSYL